ncbi:MAG: TonB-dependent receptor [Gammaproteobacteria bacterium]|nr:TonB-dependent receptor [Gammaproteobacteria bacterium]
MQTIRERLFGRNTMVDNGWRNRRFRRTPIPTSIEQQFVLTGLSDSANLMGFYDKNGISVRVAYNWRDDFLAGTGQNNVGSGPPTHVAAYQQVDVSASYWFRDDMQVYLDVLNLNDETTHVYGRDPLQTLFAGQSGPRYNFGFRYKL